MELQGVILESEVDTSSLCRAAAILAQAISSRGGHCFHVVRQFVFFSFCTLVRRRIMPRRGWLPAPDGWVLSIWMQDRQSDLQEAMIAGDIKKMLELTSLQSQGAEKLAELTGGMVS